MSVSLQMVNKNGVRIFHLKGSNRDQTLASFSNQGVSFSSGEISTGKFVAGELSNSCILIGLNEKIWFDEDAAEQSGLISR